MLVSLMSPPPHRVGIGLGVGATGADVGAANSDGYALPKIDVYGGSAAGVGVGSGVGGGNGARCS